MKRMFAFMMLVLAALVIVACGPAPAEFTIEMTEFAFTPNVLEVQVGQEVIIHLTNAGALTHEFMLGRNMMMDGAAPSTFEHNMFEVQGPVMSGGSDEHDMGAMGGADHGFMVSIPQGGEEMTMSFTVTADMVGEWEIGCFADGGSHYTQGMTGKMIVTP